MEKVIPGNNGLAMVPGETARWMGKVPTKKVG
jgi:hypothetical protein